MLIINYLFVLVLVDQIRQVLTTTISQQDVKTHILNIRKNFFDVVKYQKPNLKLVQQAFQNSVTQQTEIKKYLQQEICLAENNQSALCSSTDWNKDLFGVLADIKSNLKTISYNEIKKLVENKVKYENIKNQDIYYPHDHVMNYTLLESDTSLVLKTWMSQIESTRVFTNINYPGTFNSLSYKYADLYSSYEPISLFIQHQEKTLVEQLDMGVRMFDIRVNYYKIQVNNKTSWDQYYYCNRFTSYCYDFVVYFDVFPITDMTFQSVIKVFTDFLANNTNENILLDLTCEPDIGCSHDPDLLALIEHFFYFYNPTGSTDPQIFINLETEMTRANLNGKIQVNFKGFDGYERVYDNLCHTLPSLQFQDWLSYSQSNKYYEIDKIQRPDNWDYSQYTQGLNVQDIDSFFYKAKRHVNINDDANAYCCMSKILIHGGSYTMPHRVFKQVYKEYDLYKLINGRKYSFVYFDFIEPRDVYQLLVKDCIFNKYTTNILFSTNQCDSLLGFVAPSSEIVVAQSQDKQMLLKIDSTNLFVYDVAQNNALYTLMSVSSSNQYKFIYTVDSSTKTYQTLALGYGTTKVLENPFTSITAEQTFRSTYIKKYLDSEGSEPNWIFHISKLGSVVVRDQLCHVWLQKQQSRIGPYNIVQEMQTISGLFKAIIDYSSPPLCKFQILKVSDNSLRNDFNIYTQSSCHISMDEYGSLQLGGKKITLERHKKYPYYCYQLEFHDNGDLRVSYGTQDEELWSLFKGSLYFIDNLLTTEEKILKMNSTTLNFQGLIELTPTPNADSAAGGLQVHVIKDGVKTLIGQLDSQQTTNTNQQYYYRVSNQCTLQQLHGSDVKIFDFNYPYTLSPSGVSDYQCQIKLTAEGEFMVFDQRYPEYYVFYYQNSIKFHLYELSISVATPVFKDQVINQDSSITMDDNQYLSQNKLFSVVFLKAGGIHIYYQSSVAAAQLTIVVEQTMYFLTGFTGTAPYTFKLKNDGVIEIVDSSSAVMFTNQAKKQSGTAPYYLMLNNDGSFIEYDSTGKIIYIFTDLMEGLNMMVYKYHSTTSGFNNYYHFLKYGATLQTKISINDLNNNVGFITNDNSKIVTAKDYNLLVSTDNQNRFLFLPTGYWVRTQNKALFNKLKANKIVQYCGFSEFQITSTFLTNKCSITIKSDSNKKNYFVFEKSSTQYDIISSYSDEYGGFVLTNTEYSKSSELITTGDDLQWYVLLNQVQHCVWSFNAGNSCTSTRRVQVGSPVADFKLSYGGKMDLFTHFKIDNGGTQIHAQYGLKFTASNSQSIINFRVNDSSYSVIGYSNIGTLAGPVYIDTVDQLELVTFSNETETITCCYQQELSRKQQPSTATSPSKIVAQKFSVGTADFVTFKFTEAGQLLVTSHYDNRVAISYNCIAELAYYNKINGVTNTENRKYVIDVDHTFVDDVAMCSENNNVCIMKTAKEFVVYHTANLNKKLYLGRFYDTAGGNITAKYIANIGSLQIMKSADNSIIKEIKSTSVSATAASANENWIFYISDTAIGLYYGGQKHKHEIDLQKGILVYQTTKDYTEIYVHWFTGASNNISLSSTTYNSQSVFQLNTKSWYLRSQNDLARTYFTTNYHIFTTTINDFFKQDAEISNQYPVYNSRSSNYQVFQSLCQFTVRQYSCGSSGCTNTLEDVFKLGPSSCITTDRYSSLRIVDDGNLVIQSATWQYQPKYFAQFCTIQGCSTSTLYGEPPDQPKPSNQKDKITKKFVKSTRRKWEWTTIWGNIKGDEFINYEMVQNPGYLAMYFDALVPKIQFGTKIGQNIIIQLEDYFDTYTGAHLSGGDVYSMVPYTFDVYHEWGAEQHQNNIFILHCVYEGTTSTTCNPIKRILQEKLVEHRSITHPIHPLYIELSMEGLVVIDTRRTPYSITYAKPVTEPTIHTQIANFMITLGDVNNEVFKGIWIKGQSLLQDTFKCSVEGYNCLKLAYEPANNRVVLKRYFSKYDNDTLLFIKDLLTISVPADKQPCYLTHDADSGGTVYFYLKKQSDDTLIHSQTAGPTSSDFSGYQGIILTDYHQSLDFFGSDHKRKIWDSLPYFHISAYFFYYMQVYHFKQPLEHTKVVPFINDYNWIFYDEPVFGVIFNGWITVSKSFICLLATNCGQHYARNRNLSIILYCLYL